MKYFVINNFKIVNLFEFNYISLKKKLHRKANTTTKWQTTVISFTLVYICIPVLKNIISKYSKTIKQSDMTKFRE